MNDFAISINILLLYADWAIPVLIGKWKHFVKMSNQHSIGYAEF